ncbi:helix-turn-helix domain-containing protein [Nonomuraea sp. NPDC050310]|uniref:Crp/Fnr family transcriptional regulator n=1 Tax=Nonomuraea sp. NPDC050310 TaxID=3154935 RepID=UPI0033CB71C8
MRWVHTDHSWSLHEHLTIVLEEGWVCLRVGQPGGGYSVLDVAGPGDIVSPMHVMVPDPPRWLGSADQVRVHVLAKGRVLQIPGEVIPGVRQAEGLHDLLVSLAGEQQHALAHRHVSSHLDIPARLARLLLQLQRRFGERHTPYGTALAAPLTQADLAAWITASPSMVARTLACWRERRMIETGNSRIHIVNRRALTAVAAYPPRRSPAEPARQPHDILPAEARPPLIPDLPPSWSRGIAEQNRRALS